MKPTIAWQWMDLSKMKGKILLKTQTRYLLQNRAHQNNHSLLLSSFDCFCKSEL